mmetsp:Transcript_11208/g.15777  ORF Transcript_11208/g.15777 Transcript_11208/m.15777 type:complete len:180 (+) Transcript_11208:43-582(+)|eukprot:CAMPEP_0184857264 /NCGR_PEP_ID=MMETSP0580-20130426/2435_1 /TAXON_ID=1118495 /ORGANISM="Dactyliosolen fragilissimus" /LENGTH=179 /DNA_ID=CAMNT_0027352765 /DNA_START=34 /DNA_END=573 /DNA_ORIENTATION=-
MIVRLISSSIAPSSSISVSNRFGMIRNSHLRLSSYRFKSSSSTSNATSSPLQADNGYFGTHTYHKISSLLAVMTPVYFFAPESLIPTDGTVDAVCGTILGTSVALHSWTGLNYVSTDYIPKVSKAMLGPARFLTAGFGLLTLVGLVKVANNGCGGLRGTLTALWSKPSTHNTNRNTTTD